MQKASFQPARATRTQATRRVVCQAAPKAADVAKGVAAAALAAALSLSAVDAAHADVAGLTPCAESKGEGGSWRRAGGPARLAWWRGQPAAVWRWGGALVCGASVRTPAAARAGRLLLLPAGPGRP